MEQPSRRTVLRAAVLAAASATLPLGLPAYAGTPVRTATRLRRSVFTPHVGTEFVLDDGARRHTAVLTAAPGDAHRGGDARFSLLFTVKGAERPADGTFTVSHPLLREFPLYLGAVGPAEAGVYEAVVNS